MANKAKCRYCGKDIVTAGLKNHERNCPMNPANAKKEEEPVKVEEVNPVEEVDPVEEEDTDMDSTEGDNSDTVEVINDEESEDNTNEPQEAESVKNETTEEEVIIVVKSEVNSYIGDRYYRLLPHIEYPVSKNVKDILKRANLLEAR